MVHIVIWSRNFPSPRHDISSAPYWSKPLKAQRPLSRQALLHYLRTINISVHFCQVVIYRASLSSLCHLIRRQWLIYLCSFHMPLSEGHVISPQMLSISCTFVPWRFLLRLLFDLICLFTLLSVSSTDATVPPPRWDNGTPGNYDEHKCQLRCGGDAESSRSCY